MDLTIVAGQTRFLDFALKNDNAAFNASCMDVTGILRDVHDTLNPLSSAVVSWLWATCSQTRWSPTTCDLHADRSPYSLRFKVVDTGDKLNYYPSAVEFNVTVLSQ